MSEPAPSSRTPRLAQSACALGARVAAAVGTTRTAARVGAALGLAPGAGTGHGGRHLGGAVPRAWTRPAALPRSLARHWGAVTVVTATVGMLTLSGAHGSPAPVAGTLADAPASTAGSLGAAGPLSALLSGRIDAGIVPPLPAPAGTGPDDAAPGLPRVAARLGAGGVPEVALAAYSSAAAMMATRRPGCRIDAALLAGIGRVESDHGRHGGSQPGPDGVSVPAIRGIPLDGRPGVARILDSDGGRLDADTVFDRAVGPLQFLPGTWRQVGSDGDGDGRADPQDLHDAAASAAVYLCAGGGALDTEQGARAALFRYNRSTEYGSLVLALAAAYRAGTVPVLPTAPATVAAAPAPAVTPTPSPTPVDASPSASPSASLSVPVSPSTATADSCAPGAPAGSASPSGTSSPSAPDTPTEPGAPSTGVSPAPDATPSATVSPSGDGTPAPTGTPAPSGSATASEDERSSDRKGDREGHGNEGSRDEAAPSPENSSTTDATATATATETATATASVTGPPAEPTPVVEPSAGTCPTP